MWQPYPNRKIDLDHRDRDKLNNRKSNLRVCTRSQNQMNSVRNNSSGVKGVCWHKHVRKWVATITVNYKNIHLGYFNDLVVANKARQNAELKYHGEYAVGG